MSLVKDVILGGPCQVHLVWAASSTEQRGVRMYVNKRLTFNLASVLLNQRLNVCFYIAVQSEPDSTL